MRLVRVKPVSSRTKRGICFSLLALVLFASPAAPAFADPTFLYEAANVGVNQTVEAISISGKDLGQFGTTAGGTQMVMDSSGNLYVANRPTVDGITETTPAGVTSTFASDGTTAWGLAIDSSGNLYVADGNSPTIFKVTPGGSVSTFANLSNFNSPRFAMYCGSATWSGGGTPCNNVDWSFSGNTTTKAVNNAYTQANSITFNPTAGAYTLTDTGTGITLGSGTVNNGGIVNNSSSKQTIGYTSITLGASQTFNAAAGDLAITSPINLGTSTLSLSGPHTTTLSGTLSGEFGSLSVYAPLGTVALTGGNTYSGGTTLTGGNLQVAANGLGNGTVTVNGGTLEAASSSAQTIKIGTVYTQGSSGTLALRIGGTGSGQYDQLQVGLTASL